jgi:hypothetical protein
MRRRCWCPTCCPTCIIHVFRDRKSALTLATRLYEEAMLVPSMLPPCIIHVFRDPKSALTLATRLYEEAMLVPYMVRISIFYRENYPRAWVNTIRIYCMTDDKAEKVGQKSIASDDDTLMRRPLIFTFIYHKLYLIQRGMLTLSYSSESSFILAVFRRHQLKFVLS